MSDEVKPPDVLTDPAALKQKKCTMCGKDIPQTAQRCEHCKSLQFTTQCVVCKECIAFGSDYCNQCKSYQDIRRHFSVSQAVVALVVAVLAFTGSSLTAVSEFANRNSQTTVAFQSATLDEITISAMNTGRSPSLLRGYRLISTNHNVLEDARLEMISNPTAVPTVPGNVVPAKGGLTIRLRTTGLSSRLTDRQLRAELPTLRMVVEVVVQESDGGEHKRTDQFLALRIEDFILNYRAKLKKEVPG